MSEDVVATVEALAALAARVDDEAMTASRAGQTRALDSIAAEMRRIAAALAETRPHPAEPEQEHLFLPVRGHPDDDECTHRADGTDATYCGRPRWWHDHHPRCYQNQGVPDDLPDDLCDCRVLRATYRRTLSYMAQDGPPS